MSLASCIDVFLFPSELHGHDAEDDLKEVDEAEMQFDA